MIDPSRRGNAAPSGDELLAIDRAVALIKQVDEAIRTPITHGQPHADYYSPRGQEIVATAAHLRPGDYVVTIYRGLHDHPAKGVPLKPVMAEYFGRADGWRKGEGGRMHITRPDAGEILADIYAHALEAA